MSYLRSLRTDSAVRAANHNFVPLHLQTRPQLELNVERSGTTTSTENVSAPTYQRDRVPSQRPIDRRWDESRGLAVAKNSRNALKDYPWSPRDGVVLGRKHEHRRLYATRPIGRLVQPPPAKQQPNSRLQTPTSPQPNYGTGALRIGGHRAPDQATSTPRSSRQVEMEQQIDKLNKMDEANRDKLLRLEVGLREFKIEAKQEKEEAYARGKSHAEKEIQATMSKLQTERNAAVSEKRGLSATIATLKGDMITLEQGKNQNIRYLEGSVTKEKAKLRDEKIRLNGEAEESEHRHKLALEQAKNATRTRKEQRKDYQSYHDLFDHVHNGRSGVSDAMKEIVHDRNRMFYVADDRLRKLRTFCELHPGVGHVGEQLVDMASQQKDAALSALEEISSSRKALWTSNEALKEVGHYSRSITQTLRFERQTDDVRATDMIFQWVGGIPLRNVFDWTQRLVKELADESRNATNSTVREEHERAKLEIETLQGPLRVFGQLLSVERERQKLESWKRAPYVRKVTFLRMEQQAREARKLGRAFEKATDVSYSKMSSAAIEKRKELIFDWRSTMREIRRDEKKLEDLWIKKGQMGIALKHGGRNESSIDKEIDKLIFDNEDDMKNILSRLFGDVKGARVSGRRAADLGPSPTRQKIPGFRAASALAFPKHNKVIDTSAQVAVVRKALKSGVFSSHGDREVVERQLDGAIRNAQETSLSNLKRKMDSERGAPKVKRERWANEIVILESELRKRDVEPANSDDSQPPSQTHSKAAVAVTAPRLDATEPSVKVQPVSGIATASVRNQLYRPPGSVGRLRQGRPLIRRRHSKSPGPSSFRAYSTGALHTFSRHVQDTNDNFNRPESGASQYKQDHSVCASIEGPSDIYNQLASQPKDANDGSLPDIPTHTSTVAMEDPTDETPNSSEASASSFEDGESPTEEATNPDDEDITLQYQIPSADYRTAIMASKSTSAAFWRYSLYKNADGNTPATHYCTTFEQTETQMAKFVNEKVVGFDLEWEIGAVPGKASIQRCVSLIQIAAEDRIGLFQVGMFKGADNAEELIPSALREFLENPDIIKAGVNIGNDANRIKACFGIEMRGIFELSRLFKIVTLSESEPQKVNRSMVKLADQVQKVLLLPLAKGDVRTSAWSKKLSPQQVEYAVSDAYAGLRLFHTLEARRRAMDPRPPRPAHWELDLPLVLGDGTIIPRRPRYMKQPAAAAEKPAEEDDEDDDEKFFDAVENLDPYELATKNYEVSYPTLPSLEGLSISEDASGYNATEDTGRPPASNRTDEPTLDSNTSADPAPTQRQTTEAALAAEWATSHIAQRRASSNPVPFNRVPAGQRQLLAYHIWHHQEFDTKATAGLLRDPPLALSTVASYIAEAITKEQLCFDAERAKEVLSILPSSVHSRYASIVEKADATR